MTTSHSCNAVITSLNYNAVIIFNNFNAVTKLNMTADIFSFNASSKAGVNAGDYDIKNIFTKWSPSVFKHNVLIQLEKKGEIQTMNSNITFQFLIIVIKSYSWNAETNSMLRQEIKQCCANSMVDTSPKVDCHFNCSRWQEWVWLPNYTIFDSKIHFILQGRMIRCYDDEQEKCRRILNNRRKENIDRSQGSMLDTDWEKGALYVFKILW